MATPNVAPTQAPKAPIPPPAATASATTKKQDPIITTVKMTDGRVVEFPGKKRLIKTSFPETWKVQLDFVNGETRTWVVPEKLRAKCACHGGEQKLGDETAGLDDVDDMVEAVDELIDHLNAGEWTQRREGSGMAGTSVLLKALIEKTGKSIETVRAFLKDKTQAEKMALRTSANLKPIVDRLEAEKASKVAKVDTEAMFKQLEAAAA